MKRYGAQCPPNKEKVNIIPKLQANLFLKKVEGQLTCMYSNMNALYAYYAVVFPFT